MTNGHSVLVRRWQRFALWEARGGRRAKYFREKALYGNLIVRVGRRANYDSMYFKGSAVVDLIVSMAKLEVTSSSSAVSISRLYTPS